MVANIPCHRINEEGGHVEPPPPLARAVVMGEGVMVVVEALAASKL